MAPIKSVKEAKEASEVVSKKSSAVKYSNKQRVLVFCARGITTRYRHFLEDLRNLLPHHKKDVKVSI